MAGLTLTLNAGSSSLKFAAFQGADAVLRGKITPLEGDARLQAGGTDEPWPHGVETEGLGRLLSWIDAHDGDAPVGAVGHRVVHGGGRTGPVRVDQGVLAELTDLVPLAPLHQPHNLRAIEAVSAARPGLPQVACFDTSFHSTMDAVATTLPLPRMLRDAGARRYGFHGLSYQYIAARLRALDPALAAGRVIVAHLGSGASLCAMRDGRSVDTSMGMTALDGLVMGTRSGRLDPGVVLWMLQAQGMDAEDVEDTLYHRSGLKGVGGDADLRKLLARRDEEAQLAVALFIRSVIREAGALAAVLGGLDGIVFTAGIGENQGTVRQRVGSGLAWLGVQVDPALNDAYRACQGPSRIGNAVWVIPTDEEAQMATLTQSILA